MTNSNLARKFKLDVRGAFLRRTDLSNASLRAANLTGADFTNAILRGADLKDAILEGTVLKGADLTGARNLTVPQLRKAILDERTKLPQGLSLNEIRSSESSGAPISG
jgi:uncharacterized protein YjbI with pentapeptide repeats